MKTNKFAQLVKRGLSVKSLMTLTESEINVLHKLYEEKKKVCPKCKKEVCECKVSKKKIETKEAQKVTTSYIKYTPAEVAASKSTGVPLGNVKIEPDGSMNVYPENEGEIKENKKSKAKNPWAICTSSVGRKDKKKYEKCVKDVKKSMNENKLPFDRILENKILSLLEKHTKPSMKKGELMNLIGKKRMNLPIGKLGSIGIAEEEETKTKPKPKVKPKDKPKPHDPFRPSPDKQPAPKAKKKETKEAFMDAPAPVKEPKKIPTVKPGERPTKKPLDPFRPSPDKQPAPKARKRLPSWLTFDSLGIKFKK